MDRIIFFQTLTGFKTLQTEQTLILIPKKFTVLYS